MRATIRQFLLASIRNCCNLLIVGLSVLLAVHIAAREIITPPFEYGPTLIGLLLAAIFTRLALSRFARQRFGEDHSSSQHAPVDGLFLELAIDAFRQRYEIDVIADLVSNLVDPGGYYERVTEKIEIRSSRYDRTANLAVRVPAGRSVLMPLLGQTKDQLVDDLNLTVGGSPGTTLSYIENQGALLLVIDVLFASIVGDAARTHPAYVALKRRLQLIAVDPHVVADREPLRLLAHTARVWGKDTSPYYYALNSLTEYCGNYYFILAHLRGDNQEKTVKLSISHSFDRAREQGSWTHVGRTALGLRRRDHVFTLEKSFETVSYHFQLQAPRGMYIHENVLELTDVAVEDFPRIRPVAAEERRKSSAGPGRRQSYSTRFVHVYLRDQESYDSLTSVPALQVSLRERPPALFEVATLVSLCLALLVWIVGANHDDIFEREEGVGSWPTLLFSIPALLSTWLVSRLDAAAMMRMSVMSLFSLAWLGVNAIAAVTAAAFKTGGVQATDSGTAILGFGVEHQYWAAIMLSCMGHLCFAITVSFTRGLRFAIVAQGLTDNTRKEYH